MRVIGGIKTKYPEGNAFGILSGMLGNSCNTTNIEVKNGVYFSHAQVSPNGQYIITYCGDISPDEIFDGFAAYGVEGALSKLNGAFSIAVYNKEDDQILLAHDHLGQNPLYYGYAGGNFVFASELKAFCDLPEFDRRIDRDALSLFLRYGYIPAPYSIYKGIYKLKPGCYVNAETPEKQVAYWSFLDYTNPIETTPEKAVKSVENLLTDSIMRQMAMDPLTGAFLSGGVDSSLVVSIMQSLSKTPINTFTIGFHESGFDEAPFARAVSKHLGTSHTELYISAKDACDVVEALPFIYDEPFADSSAIPSYLVCKLAKSKVKSVLTGDAGDEIFGGYGSYKVVMETWDKLARIPHKLRKFAGHTALNIHASAFDSIGKIMGSKITGFKIHRGARSLLIPETFWEVCHEIRSMGNPSLAINASMPKTIWDTPELFEQMDMLQKMMAADTLMSLPYDMFVKMDKVAMKCQINAKTPILDMSLVKYAASLPSELKIRNGITKWPLKQILYKHVPKELIERPKSGFGVPVGQWLRGELKGWASDLLSADKLKREGYIDEKRVTEMWRAHVTGKSDYTWSLWSILMFEAWLDTWDRGSALH